MTATRCLLRRGLRFRCRHCCRGGSDSVGEALTSSVDFRRYQPPPLSPPPPPPLRRCCCTRSPKGSQVLLGCGRGTRRRLAGRLGSASSRLLLGLGLGGRGRRSRNRDVVDDLTDGFGRRELLRGLALERVLHVVVPDLGRERGAVDLLLATRPEHLQELAVLVTSRRRPFGTWRPRSRAAGCSRRTRRTCCRRWYRSCPPPHGRRAAPRCRCRLLTTVFRTSVTLSATWAVKAVSAWRRPRA